MIKGVQYVVDDRGQATAVVIDLKQHGELWEDFYDRAFAEARRDDPRESLDSARAKLLGRRRRKSRG